MIGRRVPLIARSPGRRIATRLEPFQPFDFLLRTRAAGADSLRLGTAREQGQADSAWAIPAWCRRDMWIAQPGAGERRHRGRGFMGSTPTPTAAWSRGASRCLAYDRFARALGAAARSIAPGASTRPDQRRVGDYRLARRRADAAGHAKYDRHGSEAQSYANTDAETHQKIRDLKAAFRIAALDPAPPHQPAPVTAIVGYDALFHAVESPATSGRPPVSDLAREACA